MARQERAQGSTRLLALLALALSLCSLAAARPLGSLSTNEEQQETYWDELVDKEAGLATEQASCMHIVQAARRVLDDIASLNASLNAAVSYQSLVKSLDTQGDAAVSTSSTSTDPSTTTASTPAQPVAQVAPPCPVCPPPPACPVCPNITVAPQPVQQSPQAAAQSVPTPALAQWQQQQVQPSRPPSGFIRASGTRFMLDNAPWYFQVGFVCW